MPSEYWQMFHKIPQIEGINLTTTMTLYTLSFNSTKLQLDVM